VRYCRAHVGLWRIFLCAGAERERYSRSLHCAVDLFISGREFESILFFRWDISANGRFVVFESNGNLATQNPSNADGNREIFLADYAQRRIFQLTNTKKRSKGRQPDSHSDANPQPDANPNANARPNSSGSGADKD